MRFTVGVVRDLFLQMCMTQVTIATALSAGKNATAYMGYVEDRKRHHFHEFRPGNDYSFLGDYGDLTHPMLECEDKTLRKAHARRSKQFVEVHKSVVSIIAEGSTVRDLGDTYELSLFTDDRVFPDA